MKKHNLCVTGILALVLVFGLTVVGCSNDSTGGGDDDPVNVNLSLPAIKNVAAFDGDFVENENEALELIQDAMEALAEFTDIMSEGEGAPRPSISRSGSKLSISPPPSRSGSRSTVNYPYDEKIDHYKITDGVVATGFVTGYYKESIKNDYDISVGDFIEESMRIKLAIDFDDIAQNGYTFDGKYIYDESLFMKGVVTAVSPAVKEKLTMRLNAKNGYALSVSKGGKGLKFIMSLTASFDETWTSTTEDMLDDGDLLDSLKIKLTIDIYDNSNTKQHSKIFTDLESASAYLGDSISLGL